MASGSGWNIWMWVEYMGVVSRMWVESMGVVVRRYVYRLPHTTYPYSSCICSFLQQHSYFLFIKKNVFPSCSGIFCN